MKRSMIACALFVSLLSSSLAFAEPEPAVDVHIHDAPRPRRLLAIEWNPLPLFTIGKLSANLVLVPVDHHALVLSPFYAWTNTADIYIFDDMGKATALAEQKFKGAGGELGYRYYSREGGPRGFFIGPSLILAYFQVTTADGGKTTFFDYGIAGDVGYQAILADKVSLSMGGGVQYLRTSTSLPSQQFPAKLYANNAVLPRLLLSLGWAF